MTRAARIAAIVPVYRQPALVAEAIESVLAQQAGDDCLIVLVNDGCPYPETAAVLRAYATAHPQTVRLIERRNGGLSAARNSGIRYVLDRCPSVEAIVFLDADNRLAPNSLKRFHSHLEKFGKIDWFYPAFDVFGLASAFSNGGEYSLLRHAGRNFCEAGSLVRRRVFEAGVFFDEKMRLGYEDWSFWLSAARRGFRGMPIQGQTLQYRRRPESMLSGSARADEEIRSGMRREHAWLYNTRALLELEQREAPRYLFLFADTRRFACGTDPASLKTMSLEQVEADLYETAASVDAYAPPFLVAMSERSFDLVERTSLTRLVLWDLERRLEGMEVAATTFGQSAANAFEYQAQEGTDASSADALMLSTTLLQQAMASKSVALILDAFKGPKFSSATIDMPEAFPGGRSRPAMVHEAVTRFCDRMCASPYRPALDKKWAWRKDFLPPRRESHKIVRSMVGGGIPMPLVKADRRIDVGFTTPFFDFGGVETVTCAIAKVLRGAGFRTHLFVVGIKPIVARDAARGAFDSINWFPSEKASQYSRERYLGTYLPADDPDRRHLLGLLSGLDVLINEHSGPTHAVVGELKAQGVVCMTHEHLVEVDRFGRLAGPPYGALGYEAVYDRILTCSSQLADWMRAMGAPADKIIALPNGPGYELAAGRIPDGRTFDYDRRPMRLLFLGRLDRQKGADRLGPVVNGLVARGIAHELTVVGKAVVDAAEASDLPHTARVLPAVYDSAELTRLYREADVVLMPSRFEGLPLTIAEAQRCGAIVIATDVGAVREAITAEETGFVFAEEAYVARTIDTIAALSGDPERAARISQAGMSGYRRWADICAPLIAAIRDLVEADQVRRAGSLRAVAPALRLVQ